MRKIILASLCLLLASDVFANSGLIGAYNNVTFGARKNFIRPMTASMVTSAPINQKFPDGLIFYSDYSRKSLCANFGMGSKLYTFTNTSGNVPTFDANGVSLGTTRDDVLKYYISGNRNASEETILIQFTPDTDFANDGTFRFLSDTQTVARHFRKGNASAVTTFRADSSTGAPISTTTIFLGGITYIASPSCSSIAPTRSMYVNRTQEGATDTASWTAPAWGESFWIGSDSSGANQGVASFKKVAFWKRTLTSSEVASAHNLLNN